MKTPCEHCGNESYHEAFWRDVILFCSSTCRTLHREAAEKRLQDAINAAKKAKDIGWMQGNL